MLTLRFNAADAAVSAAATTLRRAVTRGRLFWYAYTQPRGLFDAVEAGGE